MKKLLALCLTVVLCLCCLASCSSSTVKNEWFSDEILEKCAVPNLPKLSDSDYYYTYSKGTDDSFAFNYIEFKATSEEVREYARAVYEYLAAQDYKYLGTRGHQKSSLAGAFATYYFRDVDSFGECYSQMHSEEYIFVYSNDSDESDGIVFNEIIVSSIDSKTIKYDSKDVYCNAHIKLHYDESYALKENIVDFPATEGVMFYGFFRSCIIDGKETVLYDKTETGIITIDYSLMYIYNDGTGKFEFDGITHEFTWTAIDDTNIKVEFSDNLYGTFTLKDDDIGVFNYNGMMVVYETRV